MSKSKMDLFILEATYGDKFLSEITKEHYEENLKNKNYSYRIEKKMCELSLWNINLKYYINPPHPLKEVIFLEDYEDSTPVGFTYFYAFQFKHKGKYYLFEDGGSC